MVARCTRAATAITIESELNIGSHFEKRVCRASQVTFAARSVVAIQRNHLFRGFEIFSQLSVCPVFDLEVVASVADDRFEFIVIYKANCLNNAAFEPFCPYLPLPEEITHKEPITYSHQE